MSEESGTAARRVAHYVLTRVERDRAYADRTLEAALGRAPLSSRDRALATELSYGTLRHQRHLDFVLGQLATRKLSKLPPELLAALRLGAYQILHTRVPARAAVFESVALARHRHRYAAGFVNAVLRKLGTLSETGALPAVAALVSDPIEALAVESSHPEWLLRALWSQVGESETRAFVAANNERPRLSLRVNRLRATREVVAAALGATGLSVDAPALFPDALAIESGGDVRALAGFAAGNFSVQDPAAQLVARLLGPAPAGVVLDVCAAPGGKATHLAELMQDRGTVLAVDVHRARTRLIADNARRLGLQSIHVHVADACDPAALRAVLAEHGRAEVDAVLVDAPCSGLGTLRRNPELRVQGGDAVALLVALQDRLLESAASVIRRGGVLVYAVCTVTDEEGPARIARLVRAHPELHIEAPHDPALAPFVEVTSVGPLVRTWPHRHHADGFFAARLIRD